jgi:probable phosphomutase (TIGR03848 family)
MTTFLLIRHGETDAVGKLMAGWAPGWHLNARGRQQVERLAQRLEKVKIRAVYASPLERAIETAEPIARSHGLDVQVVERLGEVRAGEWQGMAFSDLDRREDWRRYNTFRSGVRIPGGELMAEIQLRMVQELESLRARHSSDAVAVVSHGDPLRAAVAWFLGIPIDLMLRFEIGTASVSVVQVDDWNARVLCVNETGEVPA